MNMGRNAGQAVVSRNTHDRWWMKPACCASWAGALAFLVYVSTLSRGLYPDGSAKLIASAAGFMPTAMSDHPVWLLLTRGLARIPWLTLPLRLNLFSALCGAAAVAVLGSLVERWFRSAVRDDRQADEAAWDIGDDPREDAASRRLPGTCPAEITPDLSADARVLGAIRLGAWAAALAFAFSVPFWSAATRLHNQTFDVLLVLLAINGALWDREQPSLFRAALIAALCGWGCIESFMFVPLTPALFAFMLYYRLRWSLPWEREMLMSLYLGAIGTALALLLLWHEQQRLPPGHADLPQVAMRLLAGHWNAICQSLPAFNWVWIVLLAFVPWLAVVTASRNALLNRSFSIHVVSLAFTVTTAICLFNAPASPWALLRESSQLPVMAYLAVAMTLGFLVAFWHLAVTRSASDEDSDPDDGRLSGTAHNAPSQTADDGTAQLASPGLSLFDRLRSPVARVLGWCLVATVGAAAILNLRAANGRNGAFADELAGDILKRLGTRTWIVSDGGDLDLHLWTQALRQRRKLFLAPLTKAQFSGMSRMIRNEIARDPNLSAHRDQLLNALELGVPSFVQEWLHLDPAAEDRLLSLNVPEVWSAAGRRPVTDGFGFTGVNDLNQLRDRDLLATHRAFWTRLSRLLDPAGTRLFGRSEHLRSRLRNQAGLSANNLGVLLEDLGRSAEATEAYAAALRIDPDNLCALINRDLARPAAPNGELSSELKRALKKLVTSGGREPTLLEVVQTYGEIRRAEALASHGLVWSRLGEPVLARAQLERALELAPTNTTGEIHQQLAGLDWRQGNGESAAQEFRSALASDNRDTKAMAGLAAAALDGGQPEEARLWLERARVAGAPKNMLTVPTAMLLEATGNLDGAIAELRTSTDSGRGTMEEWALLAGLLLKQGAISEVDRRVLPAMERLAGGTDHVLVQLVRARAICTRTPVNYVAARKSLKLCLRLRPDFASIWDDLLMLDVAACEPAALLEDVDSALIAIPEHALANRLRGTRLLEQGELTRALAAFQRSVATQPTIQAMNNLAETLRRLKRLDEAEQAARAALAMNDKIYAVWDTLGCVLSDKGQLDDAAAALEKALSLDDRDPDVHMNLANIRSKQGRMDDVRKILARPVLKGAKLRL